MNKLIIVLPNFMNFSGFQGFRDRCSGVAVMRSARLTAANGGVGQASQWKPGHMSKGESREAEIQRSGKESLTRAIRSAAEPAAR
jgi:hypothetical protein